MKRSALVVLSLLVWPLGCTRTETQEQTVTVYDPYEGEAYPNRRPTFERPNGPLGVVSNNGSDTVSLLDLGGEKVLGSAPVGRDPVDLDGPHHLAVDREGSFVYVALAYPVPARAPGPHAAHAASQRSGFVQKLALDDLRPVGEVRIDKNPGDIVLSDDMKRLVVSHFDLTRATVPGATLDERRATIAIVDPAGLQLSGSPDPIFLKTCVAPHGIALSRPDAKTAFVACYGEDALAVVDLTDPSHAPELVPIGAGAGDPGNPTYGPYAAVLSPEGTAVAVSNTESSDVRFYDVAAKAMRETTVTTFGAPYFVAWSADEERIWVPTQQPDSIVIAAAATGSIATTRTFDDECVKPHEVVFDASRTVLYVVCEGDHATDSTVLALDPETLETRATFGVGVYPDRLSILEAP